MSKTIDQARLDAVVSQRNTALNAVAEHEALIEVLVAEGAKKDATIDDLRKELESIKASMEVTDGQPA